MADSPRFPVRFDDEAFGEDLYHATPAGSAIARSERARLEREGIAISELADLRGRGTGRHPACRLREDLPSTTRRVLGDGLHR